MKKLVLLGVALTAMVTATQAQVSINVNIGSRPQYAPVQYYATDYVYREPVVYYEPVRRPVYVKHVNYVRRPYYTNNVRVSRRPVIVYNRPSYSKAYFKGNKGHFKHYEKAKGHHGRGRR